MTIQGHNYIGQKGFRVFAFEALASNFKHLQRTMCANGVFVQDGRNSPHPCEKGMCTENATIFRAAVGADNEAHVAMVGEGAQAEARTLEVNSSITSAGADALRTATLDSLLLPHLEARAFFLVICDRRAPQHALLQAANQALEIAMIKIDVYANPRPADSASP